MRKDEKSRFLRLYLIKHRHDDQRQHRRAEEAAHDRNGEWGKREDGSDTVERTK